MTEDRQGLPSKLRCQVKKHSAKPKVIHQISLIVQRLCYEWVLGLNASKIHGNMKSYTEYSWLINTIDLGWWDQKNLDWSGMFGPHSCVKQHTTTYSCRCDSRSLPIQTLVPSHNISSFRREPFPENRERRAVKLCSRILPSQPAWLLPHALYVVHCCTMI